MNFVTRDPADLLAASGGRTYVSLRSVYDSTDESWNETGTAAIGGDTVQALLVIGNRHGNETDNRGTDGTPGATRSRPDPLTYDDHTMFGKLVFKLTPHDTLKLTAEALDNTSAGDGLSQLDGAYTWQGFAATSYLSSGRVTSDRLRLDYEHRDDADSWLRALQTSLYVRNAATRQDLDIAGVDSTGATATRTRTNHYADDIVGASVVGNGAVADAAIKQQFMYGIDVASSRYRTSSSAGADWSPGTGYPETFPRTTQLAFGVFAQDDIRRGAASLVPGVRFDHYRMTPHPDATYDGASAGTTQPTTASSGHAVSPRLALLYEVAPAFVPYVQYARGFRAPSAYQVNSYYNPVGAYGLYYQQIGNPGLRPETSNSLELGLRGRLGEGRGSLRYSAAAFTGRYHGFIDARVIGGDVTTPDDPYTVQYVNYAKASVHGVEAKAEWRVDEALSFKAGIALAKGTETRDDATTGLDSVPPLSIALGAKYAAGERWFAAVDVTHSASKKKADISNADDFTPPAFTVVDLHAGLRLGANMRVTAGVDNLFDRTYWRWGDVRGVTPDDGDVTIAALTAPGRNFNLGVKFEF